MKCPNCSSILKTIEYQARSADEAQRSMVRCPNCPVNIDEFHKKRIDVHTHLKRRQRNISLTPHIDSSSAKTTKFVSARTKSSNLNIGLSKEYAVFATNYVDHEGHVFRHHHNGTWKGKGICVVSKLQLAPNVKLIEVKIIDIAEVPLTQYVVHTCVESNQSEYIISRDDISIWIPISYNDDIMVSIQTAYMMGFAPLKLSDCISQATLGSLSNLTSRAYDKYSVPDYEYMFSDKPDGERMWMTKIGMAYFFSRRLLGHVIRGWEVETFTEHTQQNTQVGPIIDIEFMYGSSPKLIDVLMDANGKVVTHQRNITSINKMFEELKHMYPILSMVSVRPFFDTLLKAAAHRSTLSYPTDGIVAVSNTGTDMFKIKSERSMELQLAEDGSLCTAEGTKLFSSDCQENYSSGTIVELRFSIVAGQVEVKNVFHRPDKQKANDMDAVNNIIQSSMKPSDDNSNIVRTEVWRWCNNLRSSIYSSVHRQVKDRGVILDIGTGDGQSLDSLISMDNISIIFVEPDSSKCRKLISKLGIKMYHQDPRSVIPAVPQLRKGTLKYHVLNCTLDKVVTDQPTMQNLKYIVSFATASFSSQFVINELTTLVEMGVSVVGCCYLYENIEYGSSIVDSHGLKMTRVDTDTAQVKWGTDKVYTEPALELGDIPEVFATIRASDFVGLPTKDHNGLVRKICSYIWILRSR